MSRANIQYLLLILPVLILIAGITFYPAIYNIIISFRNESLRNTVSRFVGFNNYVRLLNDTLVWSTLGNTIVYMFFSVLLRLVLGLGLALLLKVPSRLNIFARTSVILPWVMSEIMAF